MLHGSSFMGTRWAREFSCAFFVFGASGSNSSFDISRIDKP